MRILLVYATTEGQTRKVARAAADRLASDGHSVEMIAAADVLTGDLPDFDAAVVAGSVHLGRFQKDLEAFARKAAPELNCCPTLFLSISLSAAGDDPDDWTGLQDILDRFVADTVFQPGRVSHVAGAFRFTEYDFFRSWAMRWIAAQKGVKVDPHTDLELTDWGALDTAVAEWASAAAAKV
ncbi:MAG: protoporphyrinogen oxidase [Rhodobacteraceae bacterium]|nr:protoporphyrinogen oxidase [Paracoccaceae bacterium]